MGGRDHAYENECERKIIRKINESYPNMDIKNFYILYYVVNSTRILRK